MKQPNEQPKNRINRSAITCLGLVILMLFEILVVTVTLIGARGGQGTDEPPLVSDGTGRCDESPSPTPDPEPVVPAFSDGVKPAFPYGTGETQTVSDEIYSQIAILVRADTGEILAQKNADRRFSPASMTKVMTLIVACEQLTEAQLDEKMAFTQEIANVVGSGKYVGTTKALPLVSSSGVSCIGDRYRVRDLLYGIGVKSASDCTYMIALKVAGSEASFVSLMNAKAAELGLKDTHFDNAVGYDSEENYTTAEDMAVIMAYAMQSDLIADILAVRTESLSIDAYWDDNGVERTYPVGLAPSYLSRLEKYSAFAPTSVRMEANKTGATDLYTFVCSATGKTDGERYIVVLGDLEAMANTLKDVETLYNTYVD